MEHPNPENFAHIQRAYSVSSLRADFFGGNLGTVCNELGGDETQYATESIGNVMEFEEGDGEC